MAAAYAALVALLNTMDQIHLHPILSTSFVNYPKESLRKKIDFFLDFVENYSDADITEAEDLVRQIAVVAHEAEYLIEGEAADRIRAGSSTGTSHSFLSDLQKRIEDMASIKEKVIKVKEATAGFITQQPTSSIPPPSSSAPPATTMVGFDGYLEQLLDKLTGQHSDRQIIPIVGMGGIGKTTLARNVYENLLIVHHFDVRAWVVVSQEFDTREVLLQALSCLGRFSSKMGREADDELGEELSKILYGRRYLFVLDDMWSVEAWEKVMFYFPENNNGSRIVVTTRQQELVDYFGSSAVAVKFLNEKNSWELFCEKAFAQKCCHHPKLEQVGKMIVKKCKGLPLAIAVTGGLLGKSSRMPEYWEKIAEDISLILKSEEGNKMMSILNLSYKQLPVCLKPCFLYMGLFPEDYKIDVHKLIKLWVAEGFIKPNRDQSLEEVAESYIKDLVGRNLLLVDHLYEYDRCFVHDLVRESCIKIGEKENLYCVQRDIDGRRHFIVHQTTAMTFYHRYSRRSSIVRSLILKGQREEAPFKSRLLRVLFSHERMDHIQLDSNFREINLRFLLHPYHGSLPSSISLLWSLQTLIVEGISTIVAPSEIWKMPQLRHIDIWRFCLPEPPYGGEQDDVIILHNLRTLKKVQNLIFTEEVCKRIPNIKELCIEYASSKRGEGNSCYHLHNVSCFNKLVSLFYRRRKHFGDALQKLKLPSSLKELRLEGCKLVWSDMAMIASLPHLQILILYPQAFVGAEWNLVDDQFLCLKRLLIVGCDDLIYWIADSSNFPMLETLSLRYLSKLKEIPSSIGDIPTLERIKVYKCSESVSMSAVGILEEQQSLGNQDLHLYLTFTSQSETQMFREKIKLLLDSSCHNLHMRYFGE